MEMWILHLLSRNYVSGEKPQDSYKLWKCEYYGSGDKSGFNLSQIYCCTWKVFCYWDIFQLSYLLNKQLVRFNCIHLQLHTMQLLIAIRHGYFTGPSNDYKLHLSFAGKTAATFKCILSLLHILCLC